MAGNLQVRNKIIRTGLAVMLAGLFFVIISPMRVSLAEEPQPESDSVLLAKHIRELKIEYAFEEFSDHSFNSHYSDKQIDSLLEEIRISFPFSKFVYAPDSTFKIAVVQGEGCGAYCNHFWETWFHFNDGSGMIQSKPGFENVTSIEKLNDGKYLVWEDTYGRSGAVGYVTKTATLLSLDGHKIIYHPFPSIPSQKNEVRSTDGLGSFSIYVTMDYEEEMICDFNPQSQLLEYRYARDEYLMNDEDTCEVYAGSFAYKNGLFEFQNEICKTKRP